MNSLTIKIRYKELLICFTNLKDAVNIISQFGNNFIHIIRWHNDRTLITFPRTINKQWFLQQQKASTIILKVKSHVYYNHEKPYGNGKSLLIKGIK